MNSRNLSLMLLIVISGSWLLAQAPTSISGLNQGWINVGPGIVGGKEFGGFGLGMSLSYYPGKHIISGRYLTAINPLMIEIQKGASHIEDIVDVGFSYGFIRKNKWGFVSVSSGIGVVRGNKKIGLDYASYKEEEFIIFGIPFESQIFLTPLPGLGIGLYCLANLNKEASYLGALLCLQIGILR